MLPHPHDKNMAYSGTRKDKTWCLELGADLTIRRNTLPLQPIGSKLKGSRWITSVDNIIFPNSSLVQACLPFEMCLCSSSHENVPPCHWCTFRSFHLLLAKGTCTEVTAWQLWAWPSERGIACSCLSLPTPAFRSVKNMPGCSGAPRKMRSMEQV